ncbi:MAG TPA: AIR synthase-related protein [Candidatus Saccharimonadales bacterium]|nr:AIR synthase-related protein [Candidatus Saccharimonadales bacterium]
MSEQASIQDVNIELGDHLSDMLYKASKVTQRNRPGLVSAEVDSFSGFRAIDGDYLGDMTGHWLQIGLDGVGTKVEIAERVGDHSSIAYDLFAMVCDDAAVRGAEPLAIGTILDVRQLNDNEATHRSMAQLALGYMGAAKDAGVVVTNGELAELGGRVDGYVDVKDVESRFNYNWGGVVLWDALKSRALDGTEIQPDDALVGFVEKGLRSNGYTDLRIGLETEYGPRWHEKHVAKLGKLSLGELALQPSTIYCCVINELIGGRDPEKEPRAEVHGVAHITGGGQPSKLGRMLEPSGYGATIDNPLEPPEIMLEVQRIRGFSDGTAYGKWHMGPGMVVATPEPSKVIAVAEEHGIDAQEMGLVTKRPGIHIENKGAIRENSWLEF